MLRIKPFIHASMPAIALTLLLTTTALADPPADGEYEFIGADCSAPTTCTDSFFVISAVDGNGGDSRVKADQYGAYIDENLRESSGTSYIQLQVKDGGSFTLTDAWIGDYHPSSSVSATAFFDVYAAGYANDTLVAETARHDSVSAYEENYQLDFSDFSGKVIDTVRVYYSWTAGDTTQVYFNLVKLTIQGASNTPPPAPATAPALTATSLHPAFTESGGPIVLFSDITASTNDAGEHFTGMTVTVTNVDDGATESLRIGSTYVALTDGNASTLTIGGAYAVAVSGGTATVAVTGLSFDDETMVSLIEWLAYINSSASPGGGNRTVTITSITDSGASNNTASPNLSSTVSFTADPPSLTGMTVPANKAYKAGANLDFTVTYSESVTVTGTPYLPLVVGVTEQQASYVSGSPGTTLTFRYTIAQGDEDKSGISLGNAIELNGGTIRSGAVDAPLSLGSKPSTVGVVVDGVRPLVTTIARRSPATSNTNASSVTYRVTFSEFVSGVDASDFTVTTASGNVSGAVNSVYQVSSTLYDVTVTGITGTGSLRIDLNASGTGIVDAAANTINGGYTAGEVYTIDRDSPTITGHSVPADNTYRTGDTLDFAVTFGEHVVVTGTPYIALTLDTGGTVNAFYDAGESTATQLTFRYTVAAGNEDADGIVVADEIMLNGGTIRDAGGNDATTTGIGFAPTPGVLVDSIAPTVTSIVRQSPATSATNASGVTYRVTFSEDVTGVDSTDFQRTTVSGNVTGSVYAAVPVNSSVYDVALMYIAGNGTLRLDLKETASITDAAGNSAVDGFTSGETYTIDTAAPALSAASITASTPTTGTLNVTASEAVWAYWIAVESGATAPNPSHVIAASDYAGVTVVASGNGALPAGAGTLALTNLPNVDAHDIHVVATDAAGNVSTSIVSTTWTPPTAPAPAPAPGTNPFNPGGTQTETSLDPGTGVEPTRAPSDIVTNLGNLDNRVGISDNGVVVVLDNGLREPVKFRDNPPDNVLIALPSQKPLDVELNGNTLNIHVDPETPNPQKRTILGTTTLQLPDGTQARGFQLVQGEAAIGTNKPNAPIGGMELSRDNTLRSVVLMSGEQGGATAGFSKSPDGSGSVSAENGDVIVQVRRKVTGSSTPSQAMTLPGVNAPSARAMTADTITLTLKAGEVARFDTQGELIGVFLGSLSGNVGKTGDMLTFTIPDSVATYPAFTLVFDGGNIPARLGMPFSDFMNEQLAGELYFLQRGDGLMEIASPGGGKFYARTIRGFEIVEGAVDGPTSNGDGSLSLTYGGIRSTWLPTLEDAAEFAMYFGSYVEVLENGNVMASPAPTHFFVGRPRHALVDAPGAAQGLTPVTGSENSVHYTNARGQRQQLDPALHDEAQLRVAAAAQGWTLTRSGLGGNNLTVTSPTGEVYWVIPDFRVDVLTDDSGLGGVIRQEGNKLYFYYADEPLRQGFMLK